MQTALELTGPHLVTTTYFSDRVLHHRPLSISYIYRSAVRSRTCFRPGGITYLILGFAQPLPASTSSSAMAAPATTIAAALTPCRSSGRSSTGPGALASFSASSPCVSWNPQVKVPGPLKTPFVGPRTAFPVPARIRTPHGTRSGNSTTVRAAVSVGDKLPDATLSYLDKEDKIQTIRVSDLTRGKKVVLFAVPGAFTPTCSQKHLPGFIEKADELRAKGVQTIACVSVNDAFVMKAWGEKLNAGDKVLLLADGNGEFTRALGFSLDLSDKPAGLGVRSRRYALLAEDGVVKVLNLEEGGAFTISGAEDILKALS